MTTFSLVWRCTLAGAILLPALLAGCGGGGSAPQPLPTATTGPTATPTTTPAPEATVPGRANFNLTVGSSETVTGQGSAQIGQTLRSLSLRRPLALPGNRTAISLDVISSRALSRGDVFVIGSGASGMASRIGSGVTTGEFPIGRWKATSGQIRVESVPGRTIILGVQDVVFTADNKYASGSFRCDGTIQVVR